MPKRALRKNRQKVETKRKTRLLDAPWASCYVQGLPGNRLETSLNKAAIGEMISLDYEDMRTAMLHGDTNSVALNSFVTKKPISDEETASSDKDESNSMQILLPHILESVIGGVQVSSVLNKLRKQSFLTSSIDLFLNSLANVHSESGETQVACLPTKDFKTSLLQLCSYVTERAPAMLNQHLTNALEGVVQAFVMAAALVEIEFGIPASFWILNVFDKIEPVSIESGKLFIEVSGPHGILLFGEGLAVGENWDLSSRAFPRRYPFISFGGTSL